MGREQESLEYPEAWTRLLRGGRDVPRLSSYSPDLDEDYGEERWIGIGTIRERFAFVAFAEPSPDTIRIILLRKADHEERKEYEKAIQNGLEAH